MWDHLKRVSLGREANKNDEEEEEEAASKEEVLTRVRHTDLLLLLKGFASIEKKIRKINCHKVATVTPSLSPSLSLHNLPSPRAFVYAVAASQLFFVFLDRTCCIVNLFPDFSYAWGLLLCSTTDIRVWFILFLDFSENNWRSIRPPETISLAPPSRVLSLFSSFSRVLFVHRVVSL